VHSGYRPDWRSDRKPEWDSAHLYFEGEDTVEAGTACLASLHVGLPQQWIGRIEVGDLLEGGEGGRVTVTATVLAIDESA
jgi:hypothetical protein